MDKGPPPRYNAAEGTRRAGLPGGKTVGCHQNPAWPACLLGCMRKVSGAMKGGCVCFFVQTLLHIKYLLRVSCDQEAGESGKKSVVNPSPIGSQLSLLLECDLGKRFMAPQMWLCTLSAPCYQYGVGVGGLKWRSWHGMGLTLCHLLRPPLHRWLCAMHHGRY